MQEDSLLEKFYDVFDASNDFLYEKTKQNYFELILMTADNILNGEVMQDLDTADIEQLNKIYYPLKEVDFPINDILKALQAMILKGFKETNNKNGSTTPDTLGLFMAYLISKLKPKAIELNILDPLVGTGNLLLTIGNSLEASCNLFGVDHDSLMIKVCKMCADLIQQPIELYLQNTFNISLRNMDIIVFDLPNFYAETEKTYFPYDVINHYSSLIKEEGFILAIIPNDFFSHDKDQSFKRELIKTMSIVGLIELPQQMFIANPKSILILQNKIVERKSMLVKLPSFTDVRQLNQTLLEIETWFEKNMI